MFVCSVTRISDENDRFQSHFVERSINLSTGRTQSEFRGDIQCLTLPLLERRIENDDNNFFARKTFSLKVHIGWLWAL